MLRDETKCRHPGASNAEDTSKREWKYNLGQDLSRDKSYIPVLQLPREEKVAAYNII